MDISRVFKRVYVPGRGYNRGRSGIAEFVISPPLHLSTDAYDAPMENWPTARVDCRVDGAWFTLKCIHTDNDLGASGAEVVVGSTRILWKVGERRLYIGQLSAYLSRHGATYGTYADTPAPPAPAFVTVDGACAHLDYDARTGALNAIWANGVNIYRTDFNELTLMNAEPGSALLDSIVPVFKKLMQMHTDGECAIAFLFRI